MKEPFVPFLGTQVEQRKALEAFDEEHIGLSKGSLSLAIILTRKARAKKFPLQHSDFLAPKGGQVAGLGGGAVKKILADHDVTRILSNEGGRTSRGNIERMNAYVDVLNTLHAQGLLDLAAAEAFWVERTLAFFSSKPFTLKLDPALSLRACVRNLLTQAVERQREASGTKYAGAVMQHLVGAKLDHVTNGAVTHHGVAVADAPSARAGDFLLGDVAVHVTTAPGEALIRKCQENLSSGYRPLIVTTEDGIGGAKALAKQAGVDDRLDVIEIEQFIATNVYEWSHFEKSGRLTAVRGIVDRYNRIIDECETDPSLRIEFEDDA